MWKAILDEARELVWVMSIMGALSVITVALSVALSLALAAFAAHS